MGQVAEADGVRVEGQLDDADGAVTLLADDHLRLALQPVHVLLPLQVLLGALARFGAAQVVAFAIDEHDAVGVLLDRAGFTQVGQLRALVFALLDLTRQLRQGDDRHAQFLGQGLQAAGDLGHFLHAVLLSAAFARRHQLQVVDDDQVQAVLHPLQTSRPRRQLGDGDAAGGVDIEGALADLDRRVAQLAEVRGVDLALAQLVRGHAGRIGQNTHGQLFGAHFQRVEGDDAAVDRLAALGRRFPLIGAGHVEGHVGGERRLAHRRTTREDKKVGGVQAAQLAVQVVQAGGQTRQLALTLIGFARHFDGAGQGGREVDEARRRLARLSQRIEGLFRLFDLFVGGRLWVGRLLDHLAADTDQVATQGKVIDDAGVVGGVGRRRSAVDEVGQVAQATELVEGRVLLEPLHQDGRLGQQALTDVILDRLEQPLMEGLVHMRAAQSVAQPLEHGVVEHQRAQQRLLRLQVVGHGRDGDLVCVSVGHGSEGVHGTSHSPKRRLRQTRPWP
ncbi:hypothetical protein D3C85_918090 [compost metagenome]